MSRGIEGSDRSVGTLLGHLSMLHGGDRVHLRFAPPPAGESLRWTVWTGEPAASGGGQWGAGATIEQALLSAYENTVRAIFADRLER